MVLLALAPPLTTQNINYHAHRVFQERSREIGKSAREEWDLAAAANLLVRRFREGALGRYTLDEITAEKTAQAHTLSPEPVT